MNRARQTAVGLSLAASIVGAWICLHLYGVFAFRLTLASMWFVPLLIIAQTWLGAGMFIVAHDAMHGSLAPGRHGVNRWIGRVSLGLYAFFPYDVMATKHYAHHRHAGAEGDPDFHLDRPRAFWAWYARFFTEYFGWPQLAAIFGLFLVYALLLHASPVNAALFWGLPSILSSLQLFVFGTWLPHRHEDDGFSDRHNARTLEYGWWLSLAACFHFGYHLEHHRSPNTPWWGLPRVRAQAGDGVAASSAPPAAGFISG